MSAELSAQLVEAVDTLQRLRSEGADERVIGAALRVGALQAQEEIGRRLDAITVQHEIALQAERERCERLVLSAGDPIVPRTTMALLQEIARKIRAGGAR